MEAENRRLSLSFQSHTGRRRSYLLEFSRVEHTEQFLTNMEGCRAASSLSESRRSQSNVLFGSVLELCKRFLLVSKSSTNSSAPDPSPCYLFTDSRATISNRRAPSIHDTTNPLLSSISYTKKALTRQHPTVFPLEESSTISESSFSLKAEINYIPPFYSYRPSCHLPRHLRNGIVFAPAASM